ncbi:flagellar biosynthetic protein FliR [Oligoflexus tunisiensis]|uniref:flagellar biosynthetic protein FliR n=1 Tax=Oligoflexus tunisiensis TaxID=708132 RepID=UPI00114D2A27|nr:flagellar biosynthetic protein FliR [Oligoflexus tunisiensis]
MIYGITVESILTAALIFIRVGGILFALPFIGDQPTPVRVRILLAVALTFTIHGLVPPNWLTAFPQDPLVYFLLVIKEICIGLFIGFVARIAFDSIIMAASLLGYQMGFGVADLFMPDADVQMNAFTAFHRILMLMIFLGLNLHHIYLDAMIRTFSMIPAGGIAPQMEMGNFLIELTGGIFRVSMQLAAPVLVALMFTNTALGLIARTVPQLNVFTLSFPVGFFVGLAVYMACLPFFPGWAAEHFNTSQEQILLTLKGIAP